MKELRRLLGLELADAAYAEKARTQPVESRKHRDGFCAYWQNLRARRFALSDGRCERGCGKPASNLHHLHYASFGHEEIGDVRALCRECHKAQHPCRGDTNASRSTIIHYLVEAREALRGPGQEPARHPEASIARSRDALRLPHPSRQQRFLTTKTTNRSICT
jgi:hypothetical protein